MRDPSEEHDLRWVDSRGGVHFIGRRHDYTNGFRMAAIMRNLREPAVWADLVERIKEFLVLFLICVQNGGSRSSADAFLLALICTLGRHRSPALCHMIHNWLNSWAITTWHEHSGLFLEERGPCHCVLHDLSLIHI